MYCGGGGSDYDLDGTGGITSEADEEVLASGAADPTRFVESLVTRGLLVRPPPPRQDEGPAATSEAISLINDSVSTRFDDRSLVASSPPDPAPSRQLRTPTHFPMAAAAAVLTESFWLTPNPPATPPPPFLPATPPTSPFTAVAAKTTVLPRTTSSATVATAASAATATAVAVAFSPSAGALSPATVASGRVTSPGTRLPPRVPKQSNTVHRHQVSSRTWEMRKRAEGEGSATTSNVHWCRAFPCRCSQCVGTVPDLDSSPRSAVDPAPAATSTVGPGLLCPDCRTFTAFLCDFFADAHAADVPSPLPASPMPTPARTRLPSSASAAAIATSASAGAVTGAPPRRGFGSFAGLAGLARLAPGAISTGVGADRHTGQSATSGGLDGPAAAIQQSAPSAHPTLSQPWDDADAAPHIATYMVCLPGPDAQSPAAQVPTTGPDGRRAPETTPEPRPRSASPLSSPARPSPSGGVGVVRGMMTGDAARASRARRTPAMVAACHGHMHGRAPFLLPSYHGKHV